MDYAARTPRQLGAILKASRTKRGLTQSVVGSKVGIRQAQISDIENHGADITVDTLYRLLSALGLELVLRDQPISGVAETEW